MHTKNHSNCPHHSLEAHNVSEKKKWDDNLRKLRYILTLTNKLLIFSGLLMMIYALLNNRHLPSNSRVLFKRHRERERGEREIEKSWHNWWTLIDSIEFVRKELTHSNNQRDIFISASQRLIAMEPVSFRFNNVLRLYHTNRGRNEDLFSLPFGCPLALLFLSCWLLNLCLCER